MVLGFVLLTGILGLLQDMINSPTSLETRLDRCLRAGLALSRGTASRQPSERTTASG